ncbi:MAG: 2-hydroxyacyl-CoA dehydratase family protein [Candidatus Helarchaeota archaeon]|nr:2-hydroxyacyl-CoA dehydratase family protein [Candidatus Helarchaeota archaeon]
MGVAAKKYPMWDTIIGYLDKMEELFGKMMATETEQVVNPQFIRILNNYLKNLYKAEAEGKTKLMYNFCIPPELIYALDAYPMCQEVGSVALSIVGRQHVKYIDLAEANGISQEQCNAQKVWIGAIMANEVAKPDGIVYASQPCDSTNILYQVIQNWYKIPTYTMDVPYWAHKPESQYYDERTIPYFAKQIKGFYPWAEKNFGLKYDPEKLKQVMALSNKAREVTLDINELMTAVPAPLPSMTTFTTYMTLTTSAGTQECVDYCKWTRDKAADLVKRKTGSLYEMYEKEEKFRVVWIYIPIFWELLLYDWMERKFGAVTVMDLMGYNLAQPTDLSSEDSIFEGLAKTVLDIPMGAQSRGPAEYYLDYLFHIVKKYKADCAIYGGHMGCKHSWGIANLLKEELYKQTGIPTLLFEVDTLDPRKVDDGVIRQKIKTFFTELM